MTAFPSSCLGGDPNRNWCDERPKGKPGPKPTNPIILLMSHVRKPDGVSGCWLWNDYLSKRDGYAMFSLSGKMMGAYRAAYLLFRGPIPPGMQIDHLCRERACVSPWHMEVVTPRTNVLRGMSPGAKAVRSGLCCHGHDLSVYGYVRMDGNGRVCRACCRDRQRIHKKRKLTQEGGS